MMTSVTASNTNWKKKKTFMNNIKGSVFNYYFGSRSGHKSKKDQGDSSSENNTIVVMRGGKFAESSSKKKKYQHKSSDVLPVKKRRLESTKRIVVDGSSSSSSSDDSDDSDDSDEEEELEEIITDGARQNVAGPMVGLNLSGGRSSNPVAMKTEMNKVDLIVDGRMPGMYQVVHRFETISTTTAVVPRNEQQVNINIFSLNSYLLSSSIYVHAK